MFKSKLLTALLSIVIAFALWAYVITFVSAEREETFAGISVALQGEAILEERGLMITSQEKPTVTLTLYGKRSELGKLDSSNITITADLSKISEPGTHSLSYTPYYPGDIPSNAFTVQSQYPSMVKVTVERRITKDVPVNVKYVGSVAEDYIADKENAELSNTVVNITGPASIMDQITQAIVEVDLEGRNDTFIDFYRFTLCNASGEPVDVGMVEANVAEVSVTLVIHRVVEIPLVVTVIDGGGATEDTSSISIEPEVIRISGSESVLEALTELNLGIVDLADLTEDSELLLPINLPSNVKNITGKTEAKVNVQFPDLLTKTFNVTNIIPVNVPEGMEAELLTEELQITVRGPKALVDKMSADDLSITVDFENTQAGTFTVKANVVMGDGYAKVGAIGTYDVSVTLKEASEDKRK